MEELIKAVAKAMARRVIIEESGVKLDLLKEDQKEALEASIEKMWPLCERDAWAMLGAIEPAGWKIVPIALTEDMRNGTPRYVHPDAVDSLWQTFLETAPRTPLAKTK